MLLPRAAGPGFRRGVRLHEGGLGPRRRPDQGRPNAHQVRQVDSRSLDRESPEGIRAQPRAGGQGLEPRRWTFIAAGTSGSSSTGALECSWSRRFGFFLGGFFFAASRMLLGMGLMKLGVFSGERSRRFYLWMVGLGYGIGLPLMVFDALAADPSSSSMIEYDHARRQLSTTAFGSLVVALGHVGLLMLIVQSGALAWLTRRLAAVGRMALSQLPDALDRSARRSSTATASASSADQPHRAGGDRAGDLGLPALVSPIWLHHFRFGPAEWLWRSLTYWRVQPMRRGELVVAAAAV